MHRAFYKLQGLLSRRKTSHFLKNTGFCPCCDEQVVFMSDHEWLRDHYRCTRCGCIPRERALMRVIEESYPGYADLVIHESSPCDRGASVKLSRTCKRYASSQYFPGCEPGSHCRGIRCENLEALSLKDQSVDLFITQDVVEHLLQSDKAFKEIARVLKPGGAHIFTVPIVNKFNPSEPCVSVGEDGSIIHLREPEYHGNPASDSGSLVTMRWGYDIVDRIYRACGLPTIVFNIDALDLGIRAEYIDVLLTRRPETPGEGECNPAAQKRA